MFGKGVAFLIFILYSTQVKSAPKCDLKAIFRTPEDLASRNYDHFEILERSSFDEDVPVQNPAPTSVLPENNPRSYANAQVLLRFGSDSQENKQSLIKNPCCLNDKSHSGVHHHFYPHAGMSSPQYYPHSQHINSCPCFGHFCHPVFNPLTPPLPFVFPNYYYYPGGLPQISPIMPNTLPSCNQAYPYQSGFVYPSNKENVLSPNSIVKNPVTEEVEKHKIKIIEAPGKETIIEDTIEEEKITQIQNKDHPKILKTVDLTDEKVPISSCNKKVDLNAKELIKIEDISTKSGDILKSNIRYINLDLSKAHLGKEKSKEPSSDMEKMLNAALVPIVCPKCDQKNKLLVSYPIVNHHGKAKRPEIQIQQKDCVFCQTPTILEGPNCPCCQRKDNVEFGKRFPVDMDDLTSIHGSPISQSLNDIIEEIVNKRLLSSLSQEKTSKDNVNSAQELPITMSVIVPQSYKPLNPRKPQVHFSSFQSSSGSGSYSDPTKTVIYQEPTVVSVVSGSNQVQPEKSESCFEVVPKYDIVPKFNIVPVIDYEKLPKKVLVDILKNIPGYANVQIADNLPKKHHKGCYCSSCAKYTGELNQ